MTLAGDPLRASYVIMGVSGCGKSSIGRALAGQLSLTFLDGDDLHPASNIAKMARGEPLGDEDRLPWLRIIASRLEPGTVVACSALKRSYRDLLREAAPTPLTLLYLRGRRETLIARMQRREGHFMPTTLLDSQLAALEPPSPSECPVIADIEDTQDAIVQSLSCQICRLESLQQQR
jgi:gluconokinase